MKKYCLTLFILFFVSTNAYAVVYNNYDYRMERLQRNTYELNAKINYLENRIEKLEKSNTDLTKKNIELKKDIQREAEKQNLLLRIVSENSTNNVNKAIETINGFSIDLYNSQKLNFIVLVSFLVIVIGVVFYTLISVKRMTRKALEKESDTFIKEKVSKVNKDFEKTLHSIMHSAINDAEEKLKIPPKLKELQFDDSVSTGKDLIKVGKFEESIKYFDNAISKDSRNPDGYYHKGIALLNLGNFQEAKHCFEKAISNKPDMYDAYNQKGIALLKLGDYENALISFDNVIKLKKDFALAYNNKGIVLYQQKKYEDSIAEFNKALELKSDFANAYHNRASSYLALKNNDKAIKDFSRAIELDGGLIGKT